MLLAVTRAGRMVEMALQGANRDRMDASKKKVKEWIINVSGFSL